MNDTLKILPEYLKEIESTLETGDLFFLVQKLAAAILIGILIGLEREHSKSKGEKIFAGIRTFPLISILGFIAALISSTISYWIYVVIFIGFSSLISVSHFFSGRQQKYGGTSEISVIIIFLLGSMVFWNYVILAAIIGVITAAILALKFQLHSFVGKINEEDIYATIKLAVITVIILPLLPNTTVGPLDILNPRMIWLMVIFIGGISFIGYVLTKIYGQGKGIPIAGFMGGLVSSTAVSFSLSRKSKENPELSNSFAIGIILASTVMFPRVFIILLVFNNSLIPRLWFPLFIFTLTGFILSYVLSKKNEKEMNGSMDIKNPFNLKQSILFGIIFAVVVFASKAAEIYLGEKGIFAASAVAGITSVDAIVLSLAELSNQSLSSEIAVSAIIISLITNTVVKGLISFFLGSEELRKYIFIGLGVITGVSLIFLLIFLL